MPIAQFSGLASGIDSKSLIDAIIEARQLVNDKRRDQISELSSENDALGEFNTKLVALNDLIDKFRTANSGGLSKKSTTSDATVATAVIGSNATNASYGLTVTDIANASTGSFTNSYSSTGSFVSTAGSGNVTVTVGLGADQVVINSAVTQNSTTLEQLVADINSDPAAAGRVSAAAVNVGTTASPSYKLVFTPLEQGTAQGTLALSADPSMTELATTDIDPATDADFSIAGVGSILRSTNSVDDVISGITFSLHKAGSATIGVTDDTDTTSDKIQEIVSAYNELVKYIADNDTVEQDENSADGNIIYGTLAKTRVDNDFLSIFRSNLSTATSATGTAVRSLAEMGVSTNRDGTLAFDTDAFKDAVNSDAVGVGEVLNDFADQVSGVSGTIYQYTKFDGFVDVAEKSNQSEIDNLNTTIEALNRQTDKLKERLTRQFSNLESVTSRLQSSQQALTGILSSL